MKNYLRLFYDYGGGGNVAYNIPIAGIASPSLANNGLSVSLGKVQLGGLLGSAAAATLLNSREIPMNNQSISFTGVGSIDFTNLSNGNGQGNFLITTNGGQPFIHTGALIGGFAGSLYVGYQAGLGAVTATGNIQSMVAFGQGAFQTYTSTVLANYRGAAIGAFALQNETSGIANVALGWAAGNAGLNFSQNVLIGSVAGTNIDNGSNQNVLVGIGAGGTDITTLTGGLTTINNSVLLGWQSGCDAGGTGFWTNIIMIGAGTNTTAINTTINNTTIIGTAQTTNVSNVCMLGNSSQNIQIKAPANQADLGSALQVFGSFAPPITVQGGNFALTNAHFTVIFTAVATATLPTAASSNQRIYAIVAASAGAVTTSINFNNLSNTSVNTIAAGTSVMIQSDGATWRQIK